MRLFKTITLSGCGDVQPRHGEMVASKKDAMLLSA
jgi:hypothetical protein